MEVQFGAAKKEFLTNQDAAKILGVSLRTVQLWVENGSLQTWKMDGGHKRVTYSSVDQLLIKRHSNLRDKNNSDKLTKLKVLVVEDEKFQMMMYQLKFEQWDLPIHLDMVSNGIAALTKIEACKPDVLIFDLNLPGMDGFQMLNNLQSIGDAQQILQIAVTSLTRDDILERGGLPESVSVFFKPIPFHLLETLLKDILIKRIRR